MKLKINYKYSIGDKVILNDIPLSTINRYKNEKEKTIKDNINIKDISYSIIGYGWRLEYNKDIKDIIPNVFYLLDITIPQNEYFISGWDRINEDELSIDNNIKDNSANSKEEIYIMQDHNKFPLELNDIVYYNTSSCLNNTNDFISGNIIAFEHFMIASPTLKGGYYLLQNNNCINVEIKSKSKTYIDDMFFTYRTMPDIKKKKQNTISENIDNTNIDNTKFIQL